MPASKSTTKKRAKRRTRSDYVVEAEITEERFMTVSALDGADAIKIAYKELKHDYPASIGNFEVCVEGAVPIEDYHQEFRGTEDDLANDNYIHRTREHAYVRSRGRGSSLHYTDLNADYTSIRLG